jgi:hypothetical protein
MLWGDSHADHLVGAFEVAAEEEQLALLPRWFGSCPPLVSVTIPGIDNGQQVNCARFNSAVLSEIDELQQVNRLAGVILAARWSQYSSPRPELIAGLRSTLRALAAREIKVLVVAQAPEQPFEPLGCLARYSASACSVSRSLAEAYQAQALGALQEALDETKYASLWNPLPLLCDKTHCPVERGGVVVYGDKDHLTVAGSHLLGRHVQEAAAWCDLMNQNSRTETTIGSDSLAAQSCH